MELPRMSNAAEKVISAAAEESKRLDQHFVGVEHLFMGLAKECSQPLTEAFAEQQQDLSRFVSMLKEKVKEVRRHTWGDQMIFTPRCSEVIAMALRAATRGGATEVEPLHLVEGLFREGRSVPIRLMRALDIDVPALQETLLQPSAPQPRAGDTPILNQLGRDLTAQARAGRLSPVVGRKHEMDLLAQVLLRRNKNNPVLLGEAGVGKTAVVEGFAQILVSHECPEPLRGLRLIELSVSSLVAGTRFRGEFEERLLGVIKEVAAHPNITLFLDEIHGLVGAGSTGSGDSLDAGNILKPALARGEMRCIGATTVEEYRRTIERDTALDRRFAPIMVEEPTRTEALEVLTRLKPSLESFHQVSIADGALKAAVDLTVQHMIHRRLPDKAIDALDQSCARRRLQRFASGGSGEKEQEITDDDVRATVAQWTGIPLERLSAEQARDAAGLEEELRRRVIGQDRAVASVARAMLTAKAGLASPNHPLGVFLFLGPTGVGKTHLAKSLAQVLFGDEKKLTRFDMSEYSEPHSVAKLIGAPPGYVGYEQEGALISALRTHPHSVVLFDEIEKAHPQIFDLFLQIFDEGRLAGAHGDRADFTQAVVILTSNVNPRPPERRTVGFSAVEAEVVPPELIDPRAGLFGLFRPELINRIDEIVQFRRLGRDDLRRIIDSHVRQLDLQLAPRNLHLEFEDEAYEFLIQRGYSETYGARELRREFDRHVRHELASALIRLDWPGDVVKVVLRDGGIRFEARQPRNV